MKKKTKNIEENLTIQESHSADVNPFYEDKVKKKFVKQGGFSFIDEFYTLYRRWVKNE